MLNIMTPHGAGTFTPAESEAALQLGSIPSADGWAPAAAPQVDTEIQEALDRATRLKRQATVAAKLALRGYELRQLHHGSFLIVSTGLTRHVPELESAEATLRALEVQT
jgi:hypothetical protein